MIGRYAEALMHEAVGALSPLTQELAPIFATIDGPERAGKITPADIAMLTATMRTATESVIGNDAPEYVRMALDAMLSALQRYGLEESARRGNLMLDSEAEASHAGQAAPTARAASESSSAAG